VGSEANEVTLKLSDRRGFATELPGCGCCFLQLGAGSHDHRFHRLLSALDGKGLNFACVQAAFEGVEINKADRLRQTWQRNGAAIPFGCSPVQRHCSRAMTDCAPEARRAQRQTPNCHGCSNKIVSAVWSSCLTAGCPMTWALTLPADHAELNCIGHSAATSDGRMPAETDGASS
jgi:hypothetical protein